MARATAWTDRLAERVVLELVRSTTEKRPTPKTWPEWMKSLRKKRTPLVLAADLRKIAAGGLMQRAEFTRETLLDAADLIEGVFGSTREE
jgi:hypothetical protein